MILRIKIVTDSRMYIIMHYGTKIESFPFPIFYLNIIEQLVPMVEQLVQLEVCLPYSRLLAGIPILAVYQNLRWNSNKSSLL